MIRYKSKEEVAKIKASGDILAACLDMLANEVKEGCTPLYLDSLAEEFIRDHKAVPAFKGYQGFPGSLCTSVNQAVVHGIPSEIPLKSGDIIGIDCGVILDGFVSDSAVTFPVGEVTSEVEHLLLVTQESLYEGLRVCIAGNYVQDISRAIEKVIKPHGYGIIRELVGHGVGYSVHEEPNIPNFDFGSKGAQLKPGMVIAIEPMVNLGGKDIRLEDDDWTISTADNSYSAHFEHTVAITEDGPEILTVGKGSQRPLAWMYDRSLEESIS